MTHSELLGVMHGQLIQVTHQLSHLMSVVGGMIHRIEATDPGAVPDDAPPEDFGIYRGISGAYAPVRVVRPTGDEAGAGGDVEPFTLFDPPDAASVPVPEPWRDRLAFDLDVSDVSPVIRGTWVTVGRIVAEIADGRTWADVMLDYPELTEDDIRAALAYAVDEAGRENG